MTAVIQLKPEGQFGKADLDRLLFELEGRLQEREVMRIEQAAEFLNVSMTTIHLLCKKGLPHHRLDGLRGKIFLRGELVDYIKKH